MVKGYLQFDAEYCKSAVATKDKSGSVALSVIIQGRAVYVANIGDCAAVLCRAGDAILLSDEHPLVSSIEEQTRVKKAGGTISRDGRLNGDLAVSRAFGDMIYSSNQYGEDEEGEARKAPGLSAKPVVQKHFLSDEDEFMILACDGIFDYVNYKNAVQTVRRNLRRYNDVERAASRLIQFAQSIPSHDNMTCVVVAFPKTDEDGKTTIVKPSSWQLARGDEKTGRRRRFNWGVLISDTTDPAHDNLAETNRKKP